MLLVMTSAAATLQPPTTRHSRRKRTKHMTATDFSFRISDKQRAKFKAVRVATEIHKNSPVKFKKLSPSNPRNYKWRPDRTRGQERCEINGLQKLFKCGRGVAVRHYEDIVPHWGESYSITGYNVVEQETLYLLCKDLNCRIFRCTQRELFRNWGSWWAVFKEILSLQLDYAAYWDSCIA